MDRGVRYLGQALLYAVFFVLLAYLTHMPIHRHLAEGMAVLKIAVRHPGAIVGECTSVSGAGQGMRPSAMQQNTEICPRERSPLQLELILDGETLYLATVPATGLHKDGISSMYQQFSVPAGSHHLQIRMNDDVTADGYTWQFEQDIELQPAQVVVASFKEGFRLQ
jgi:hypothetical protein